MTKRPDMSWRGIKAERRKELRQWLRTRRDNILQTLRPTGEYDPIETHAKGGRSCPGVESSYLTWRFESPTLVTAKSCGIPLKKVSLFPGDDFPPHILEEQVASSMKKAERRAQASSQWKSIEELIKAVVGDFGTDDDPWIHYSYRSRIPESNIDIFRDKAHGSEHFVLGQRFPAELQANVEYEMSITEHDADWLDERPLLPYRKGEIRPTGVLENLRDVLSFQG